MRRRKIERSWLDREAVRYFVYRLHDAQGEVLYVGRSCNVRNRIRSHSADASQDRGGKAGWFFGSRSVSMVGPFTWDEAVRVERAEIEKHQPIGNRDLTARDRRPAVASRSARRAAAQS